MPCGHGGTGLVHPVDLTFVLSTVAMVMSGPERTTMPPAWCYNRESASAEKLQVSEWGQEFQSVANRGQQLSSPYVLSCMVVAQRLSLV
jgi:hypothetical protein